MIVTPDGRRIFEHRYFMEKHIGRAVSDGEHVHHINHNGLDNRIENLQLLSPSEHSRIHSKERWSKPRRWSDKNKLDACVWCGRSDIKHGCNGHCLLCKAILYNYFFRSTRAQKSPKSQNLKKL